MPATVQGTAHSSEQEPAADIEQAVAALHDLRRDALAEISEMASCWRLARRELMVSIARARKLEIPVRDCAAAAEVSAATAQRWTVETLEEQFRVAGADNEQRA